MRFGGFRMNGLIACCVSAAILLAIPGTAMAASCESSANYGAIYPTSDLINAVKALPPEALIGKKGKRLKSLPKSVLLSNLPAVAQQGTTADPGSPGTCEAQSYGYGLGSYTAARNSSGKVKWQANQAQYSNSAAYLYALIQKRANRKCPEGSRSLDYLEQLVSLGAPSRGQLPYQPTCTYLDQVDTGTYANMERFRIGSYAIIPIAGNADAVEQIKSQLSGDQAVAFTGRVLCGYATKPSFTNGVIYSTDIVPDSGHGQLIVGYNDKVGKANASGGFLVQNSFGTSWPPVNSGSVAPPGKAYWSYNSFATTQSMAAVAYPVADGLASKRLQTSSVNVAIASVAGSYQWRPGGDDKSVYLIVRLAFSAPVMLNEVLLTEPGGSAYQVRAVYGQSISAGYVYLKRTDGKSFLSGRYSLKLKTTPLSGPAVNYTGDVKVKKAKKLKKTPKMEPASMRGAVITGPTGATVTTN